MKKRDWRLEQDKDYFEHAWQSVKESVRQLMQDNKRNASLQKLCAELVHTNSSQLEAADRDIEPNENNF